MIKSILFVLVCCCALSAKANTADSLFPKIYVWDTTQAFSSHLDMMRVQRSSDSVLNAWCKSNPNTRQRICDSLRYAIMGPFALVLYKTLLRNEKNEKNFFALQWLAHISNNIEKDRLVYLFNQYPKKLRESDTGKKILDYISMYGLNEGHNIRKPLAATPITTRQGKKMILEKIIDKRPVYILAFGASWCSPCKYNNRILHQAAADWDTSRFKIIHLSIDTDPKKWEAGEKTAGYERMAYLLKGGVNSNLTKALSIKGVQRYIVINDQADVIIDHTSAKMVIKKLGGLVR